MTDYYVKPAGDNGLDGLSEANAWATIDHAQNNIIANDEVHIAAGTYNETSAFIFNPPAGTLWTGADINNPALTKLFTVWYPNHFVITNDSIEIHGCQVGRWSYPTLVLNNTGFKMVDCLAGCHIRGSATDLILNNVQSSADLLINLDSPDSSVNGTFTDVIYTTGAFFRISGAGNTITRLKDHTNRSDINCSDINMSDCMVRTLYMWGSSGNLVDLLEVTTVVWVLKDASADGAQTFTNCKDIAKASVETGASLTLQWYQKRFYESSNSLWSTIDSSGQPAIAIAGGSLNITFTERSFAATPDADIDTLIESWELTGDQNKGWKVEATGSRTVIFQLGDMLPDTKYDLKVGGSKVSDATSDASGVITFPAYTGSFSEKAFTTALYVEPPTLLDIADYKTESFTISKGIQDALWVLNAQIDKHVVPAFFKMLQATATDHRDITHTPFVGIIPATDYALAAAANKATITGYDYAWYLTVQYVPADAFPPSIDRTTLEDTNPSETITTLLGGTAWATVTGIEPYRINTVTDWENIKKAFEFGETCTRWKAIQEICDYCNFVFVVKWRDVAGMWRPCAYFVHEDDIDSSTAGLDIPAMITITEPDAYLMDGISVKDSPEHQYNRVLVTGYDVATGTYYYAEAKKLGTEIPIEYVYADASLNTQDKTETKAQELLDFFQASAKVYVARFKRRMDLELYQKVTFSGYDKIDTDEMRITRITYSRAAANDIVEIEFSKDQAIQQLKRLARAVNPDYVAGTQDMMHSDLSDIGLIDVFDDPIAGGTADDDLWEMSGAYLQPIDVTMLGAVNIRGLSLDNALSIRGNKGAEFSMWGGAGSLEADGLTEFMRWHNFESGKSAEQYLEISSDLYINNDPRFPKIYFDIDFFRPTYIGGNWWDGGGYPEQSFDALKIVVGGSTMMRFHNSDSGSEYIEAMRDLIINPNLIMGGSIKGYGNNDLKFWDNATGVKTLKELAAAGGGGEHTHSAADITSGTLAMRRGGTGNAYGDAETVGGWSVVRLIGNPASFAPGTYKYWTWYGLDSQLAVVVSPDLSYESSPNGGSIVAYVTKQEESNDQVTVYAYNGCAVTQYIGVRGIVIYRS